MKIKPNIQYIYTVIKTAELFLESLEQLEDADFSELSFVSEKRDAWKLKFHGAYENEDFCREIILHVNIPSIEVQLVSDKRIR